LSTEYGVRDVGLGRSDTRDFEGYQRKDNANSPGKTRRNNPLRRKAAEKLKAGPGMSPIPSTPFPFPLSRLPS
jgi:hypothetical protein